jgi:hypothetical protein
MKVFLSISVVLAILSICTLLWSNSNFKSNIEQISVKEKALNELVIRQTFYGGMLSIIPEFVLFKENKCIY